MIKTELYKILSDQTLLVKTFSTNNVYIKRSDSEAPYESAVDLGIYDETTNSYRPLHNTYIEISEKIKTPEEIEAELKNLEVSHE
jgi:hypothetical protein